MSNSTNSTEVASLIAKLTLDASQFTENIESLSSKDMQDLEREIENTAQGLQHALMLDEADELSKRNAQLDLQNDILDTTISIEKNLGSVITNCVYAARDMETAWAGVRNSVEPPDDVDADQWFGELKNEVYQLSTEVPETIETVMKTMQAAGKANVDPENIVEYSKAVLQLKEASNGAFSESDIINYFDAFQSAGTAAYADVDNWASAVLAVGKKTSATEKDVLRISSYIASVGSDAGMSADQILAWGGYMADVGINSGAIFMKMTSQIRQAVSEGDEKLGTFAKTAGMNAENFSEKWETDASGALEAFVTGLGNLDKNSKEFNTVMKDMGLNSSLYASDASKLTSSTSELSNMLDTANTAFTENTELVDTAAISAGTLDSKAQMFENTLTVIKSQLGDSLLPILQQLSDAILPVIKSVSNFIAEHPDLVGTIGRLASALYMLTIGIQFVNAALLLSPLESWLLLIGGIITLVDLVGKGLEEVSKKAEETSEAIAAMTPGTGDIEINGWNGEIEIKDFSYEAFNIIDEETGDIVEVLGRWDAGLDRVVTKEEDLAKAVGQTSDVIAEQNAVVTEDSVSDQIVESMEETKSAAEQANDIITQLNEALSNTADSSTQMDSINASMDQLNEVLESEAFQQFANQPVDPAIGESWEQFGLSVKNASDSFTAMNSLLSDGGDEGTGLNAALSGTQTLLDAIRASAENLAAYFTGDFIAAINAFLAVVCLTSTDQEGNTNAGGGNTLYTALGAVYGLFCDILATSRLIADHWTGEFITASMAMREEAGTAAGVVTSLGLAAQAAADQFGNLAGQIMTVVAAYLALQRVKGGGGGNSGSGPVRETRASGGPVYSGSTYLVGEQGPELFAPRVSGTIIPNEDLGGSGGQTINVIFQGEVIGDEKSISAYVTKAVSKGLRRSVYVGS